MKEKNCKRSTKWIKNSKQKHNHINKNETTKALKKKKITKQKTNGNSLSR